jgi:hypothetical protein
MLLNNIDFLIQITESAWGSLGHTLLDTASSTGKALWREGRHAIPEAINKIGTRVTNSTAHHRGQLVSIDKSKLKDEAINFAKSDTAKKIALGTAGAIGLGVAGKYALGQKTALTGAKLAEKGLNKVTGAD